MKKGIIFCTCAENNQQVYLQRIKKWYKQLDFLKKDFDIYVAVDGQIKNIPQELKEISFENFTPILGRKSIPNFPGFKRSFLKMIQLCLQKNYKHFIHIENDVKILNFQNINKYIYQSENYCSYNKYHNFIETAFLIINDVEELKSFYNSIDKQEFIHRDVLFQHQITLLNFKKVFKSYRKNEDKKLPDNPDFVCQSFGRNGKEYV